VEVDENKLITEKVEPATATGEANPTPASDKSPTELSGPPAETSPQPEGSSASPAPVSSTEESASSSVPAAEPEREERKVDVLIGFFGSQYKERDTLALQWSGSTPEEMYFIKDQGVDDLFPQGEEQSRVYKTDKASGLTVGLFDIPQPLGRSGNHGIQENFLSSCQAMIVTADNEHPKGTHGKYITIKYYFRARPEDIKKRNIPVVILCMAKDSRSPVHPQLKKFAKSMNAFCLVVGRDDLNENATKEMFSRVMDEVTKAILAGKPDVFDSGLVLQDLLAKKNGGVFQQIKSAFGSLTKQVLSSGSAKRSV